MNRPKALGESLVHITALDTDVGSHLLLGTPWAVLLTNPWPVLGQEHSTDVSGTVKVGEQ